VIIQTEPSVSCRSFCRVAKHSTQSVVWTCGEAQGMKRPRHNPLIQLMYTYWYIKPASRNTISIVDFSIVDRTFRIRPPEFISLYCLHCTSDVSQLPKATKGNYQHFTIFPQPSKRQKIKQQLCHRPWPKSMADKGELEKAGILAPSSWGDDPGTGSDTNRASTRCICNMQVRGIVLQICHRGVAKHH
jgi:hypothetical protein